MCFQNHLRQSEDQLGCSADLVMKNSRPPLVASTSEDMRTKLPSLKGRKPRCLDSRLTLAQYLLAGE